MEHFHSSFDVAVLNLQAFTLLGGEQEDTHTSYLQPSSANNELNPWPAIPQGFVDQPSQITFSPEQGTFENRMAFIEEMEGLLAANDPQLRATFTQEISDAQFLGGEHAPMHGSHQHIKDYVYGTFTSAPSFSPSPSTEHTESSSSLSWSSVSRLSVSRGASLETSSNNSNAEGYKETIQCRWGNCTESIAKNRDAIRVHFTTAHTLPHIENDAPVRCQWGDCASNNAIKYLLKHLLAHTQTADRKCPICDKTLARTDVRNRHLKMTHGIAVPRLGEPSEADIRRVRVSWEESRRKKNSEHVYTHPRRVGKH